MKKAMINQLRQVSIDTKHRRLRWWTEGKKDGMCGLYRDLSQIPKIYREHYNSGHIYGALSREVAYA